VQACEDIAGRFVFGVAGRGSELRLMIGATDRFADSDCVACGACVELCPSGALSDRDRIGAEAPDSRVESVCGCCGGGCRIEVSQRAGRVLRGRGVPGAAANRGQLCAKGRYAHGWQSHPERLREPLVREGSPADPRWRAIAWPEATALAARRLREIRERFGADAPGAMTSSRSTNEASYLLQRLFRAELGSNHGARRAWRAARSSSPSTSPRPTRAASSAPRAIRTRSARSTRRRPCGCALRRRRLAAQRSLRERSALRPGIFRRLRLAVRDGRTAWKRGDRMPRGTRAARGARRGVRLPAPARREAILEAAIGAFSGGGYSATSMSAIARASRVTPIIVYRHFASKEALYRAALARAAQRFSALLAEQPDASGFGVGARSVLAAARGDPHGFRLLWRHAGREPRFAPREAALRERAIAGVRQALAARVPAPALDWSTHAVASFLVDAVLHWLDYGRPELDERFASATNAALRAGVKAWSKPAAPGRARGRSR